MKPTNKNSINPADHISDNRYLIDSDITYSHEGLRWNKKKKRYIGSSTNYGINKQYYVVNGCIRMIDSRSYFCCGYDHYNM